MCKGVMKKIVEIDVGILQISQSLERWSQIDRNWTVFNFENIY